MERVALVIENTIPINCVVLPNGKAANTWLKNNPNAVEITDVMPQPGVGTGWTYSEGQWSPPIPEPLSREEVDAARLASYQISSDPIFFEYQRGDKTQQDWLDAVQAVKDAHPYPPTA